MDRRERHNDAVEASRTGLDALAVRLWTALPGIIQAFDPNAMTVSVQPAVHGAILDRKGKETITPLPVLVDVPVVFPAGGGFCLTFPVRAGDECLVVFASRCIDGWWQHGGVRAAPEARTHDLSDGFALVGPHSRPRALTPGVHTAHVRLRAETEACFIELTPENHIRLHTPACSAEFLASGAVTLKAAGILRIDAERLEVSCPISQTGERGSGPSSMKNGFVNDGGTVVSNGIVLERHTHGGVESGASRTDIPV